MDYYYEQPRYFGKFSCIGGECPESCCTGWKIDWLSSEYDKLKNADMSDELRKLVERSFKEDEKGYSIKMSRTISFSADGEATVTKYSGARCPMQNRETGLCEIQKELGEEYLGLVCRYYPRRYFKHENVVFRSCSASCPAVLDLIFNDNRAMEREFVTARDTAFLKSKTGVVASDKKEDISLNPALKYRFEMFDFFWDILLNSKHSTEVSLIMGALAAQKLSDAAERGEHDRIPEIIKALTPQINNVQTARAIDEIKPNYNLKFKLANNAIVKFFGDKTGHVDISVLHDGQQLIVENYLQGIEKFNKVFEGRDFVFRNIVINTFLDCKMPFVDRKKSIFENYSYLALCTAIFRTVAAAVGFSSEDIEAEFRYSVSAISRIISHTASAASDIMDDIKATGLTTPAHLALIIK